MVVQWHISSVDGRSLDSTVVISEAAVRLSTCCLRPEISGICTLLEAVAEASSCRHEAASVVTHRVPLYEHRCGRATLVMIPGVAKGLV